jgi:RimJ/RimL family protein N-acetyltransferase
MKFFLTQFTPSIERTEKWLKEIVIPSKDRILFLIYTLEGNIVGNFGICNINYDDVELDNLIRGEKGGDPQLIYYSEISLLNWIFSQLNVQSVILHVFSNNPKTITLHEKVGFKIIKEYNLWKKNIESDVIYSTTDNGGDMVNFCYLEMSLAKDEFISKN